MRSYYDALISQDYEKAYKYVLVYDNDTERASKYSYKKSKEIYVSRMNKLAQQRGYKVISAAVNPVKYSDGLYYNVKLVIQIDGKFEKYSEDVRFVNTKLYIDWSIDTYGHLRDGRMEG